MNINRFTEFETTSCKLQFANNRDGNKFYFGKEDSHINFVDIWLIIPAEYGQIGEIPTGSYRLKNLNRDTNEQYDSFDIANSNRIIVNGFMKTVNNSTFFNPENVYGGIYDDVEVNVSKDNNGYSIEYSMIYQGKNIMGIFNGELEVVDNW